jgi:hypothetical protein
MLLELAFESLRMAGRRVQKEIAISEPDHGHAYRHRHTEDAKGATVDDPDSLCDRLQLIERRIGRIFIRALGHVGLATSSEQFPRC